MSDNKSDYDQKLELLRMSADLISEKLDKALDSFSKFTISELMGVASILKTIVYVTRDLYGLPNFKDESAAKVARARLDLAKSQLGFLDEEKNEREMGIVFSSVDELIEAVDSINEEFGARPGCDPEGR